MPTYKSVRLVCGKRPKLSDSSVTYCAAAAFTGECLNSFVHRNIAGNHVSDGVYYKSYVARTNTGAFVWYQGKWKFLYEHYAGELREAERYGGMGFGQNMIIYNGRVMPLFRKDKPLNIYRALCELNGKLCIVESKQALAYSEFVAKLANLKVKYALYYIRKSHGRNTKRIGWFLKDKQGLLLYEAAKTDEMFYFETLETQWCHQVE